MKKCFTVISLALALIFIMSGCKNENAGGDTDNPLDGEFITVLTGGSSGVYYPLGGTIADIYQSMGANANSQSTAASAENATTLNQGKAEIGFALGDTASDAYEGVESFEEKGAQENLRTIASIYPNYLQIVAFKKSGIETIEDLKGKRVAVGAPASGTEVNTRRILDAYNMSFEDIKEDFLSFSEGVEGMKNGNIDAVVMSSGLPNAGVLELETENEINIVEIKEEKVLEMQEKYPTFFSAEVSKGIYDSMEEDVETIGINNVLLTHKDVSDEVAYEMTKGIFDNLEQLQDSHNAAKDIDIEEAVEKLPAPLHPGAEKYFKEEGIEIEE